LCRFGNGLGRKRSAG
jgi:hypothetical protein